MGPPSLPAIVAAGFRGFPHGTGVGLCLLFKCMVIERVAGFPLTAPPSQTCRPARLALGNQARSIGMRGDAGEGLSLWSCCQSVVSPLSGEGL